MFRMVEQCHFTYVTKFKPSQEEICDENFEKKCQISFKQQAYNETVKKCYKPVRKVRNREGNFKKCYINFKQQAYNETVKQCYKPVRKVRNGEGNFKSARSTSSNRLTTRPSSSATSQ